MASENCDLHHEGHEEHEAVINNSDYPGGKNRILNKNVKRFINIIGFSPN